MTTSTSRTLIFDSAVPDGRVEPKHMAYLWPQTPIGTAAGPPLPLDRPELTIGRGEEASYRLGDPQASRLHARILSVHNRYYIQDLGSTNGTFLNGDRVGNERLAQGDLLRLGSSLFRFEVSADLDFDYLTKINLGTITSLAEAVDKKDPYTGSHSNAVAEVAARLAQAVGIDAAGVERIRIAGRLHDIGKIGVPDAVLRKQGPLDDDEFAMIRRHPVDGEAILAPLEFLADIVPVVRHHHERFDGRGYPDGLSGEAIPFAARIVQVADTFHAMASRRPYREIQGRDYIREQFRIHRGTQFDPDIAGVFLDLLDCLGDLGH